MSQPPKDNRAISNEQSTNLSYIQTNQSSSSIESVELTTTETLTPPQEETRASFTGKSTVTKNPLNKDPGLSKPQTSPLLSSTPPTVSKALIRSYPYLLIVNKLLGIVTWTGEDVWLSILVVLNYVLLVSYFEVIITYFGHLLVVGVVAVYALLNQKILEEQDLHPTLDDVVQALTTTTIRADLLVNPITSLSLTAYDLKRLLFTTMFLSPIYIILTFFLISPRVLLLAVGTILLTYHSSWSRVTRKILWRMKLVRLLCFYLTGLDFSGTKGSSIFAAAVAKVKVGSKGMVQATDGKPVRFTYVIYENQRRWLGIGWTPNLLTYERTPWTDEFLNESSSTDSFKLPETDDGSRMVWRWVDKTWRLDLTNDGALVLPSNRSKTTADPGPEEGFVYYDNTWKKPSTEDSFSKYTRRRRWIRTAELVPLSGQGITLTSDNQVSTDINFSNISTPEVQTVQVTGMNDDIDPSGSKKRKSLRFEHKPTILESVKDLERRKSMSSSPKEVNFSTSAPEIINSENVIEDDTTLEVKKEQ